MAKIYLSSTYSDLIVHRQAVYQSLRQMRHDVLAMEDYAATDQRPVEKCLEDVESCEVYIGIFAWRYGYIPTECNPKRRSVTELEYRKAVEKNKPRLIFLLDENVSWPPKAMDTTTGEGNRGKRITALRQELSKERVVAFFRTDEDLASLVSRAIHNWESAQHGPTSVDKLSKARTKYLQSVCRRYGVVSLPIGPAEGLSLQAIFQPLALCSEPLAAEDLERKKRRTLLGENAPQDASSNDLQPPTVIAENGDDALTKSPQGRMVVLGGPGTGKTTTLKYLVSDRAQKALIDANAFIPVYISLSDLTRSEKTLHRYLTDIVEDMKVDSFYADVLWDHIEGGRAFVCFDSLDEINPQQRTKMIGLINEWALDGGNIWIVGSRFTEYKGGQFKRGQFAEWELLPMSHELRLELAQRLLSELQRSLSPCHGFLSTDFVTLLEKHPQAAAWGENPLLFSLAEVVFLQTGGLPASRTLLYQEVINAVLKTREHDPVQCRLLLRVLMELALWLYQMKKGRTFSLDDLVVFFGDVQKMPWDEIAKLSRRITNSGVMELVAHDTYGFRHQTFQEYLAAAELARRFGLSDAQMHEETWRLLWSKRTYSRWSEILRLMVGVLMQTSATRGEAQRWLQALIGQRDTAEGDPGNLGLLLAVTSLAEMTTVSEQETLPSTGMEIKIASLWVRELLATSRHRQYVMSNRLLNLAHEIRHLDRSLGKIVSDQLLDALNEHNNNVREIAAQALGRLGDHVPMDALLQALQHGSWQLRCAAVTALGEMRDRAPIELFIQKLQDESGYVRSAAAEALGQMGKRAPLEPLLQALSDRHLAVRAAATRSLAQQKERVLLEFLFPMLRDTELNVQVAIANLLGRIGERVPLEPLLQALQDENWQMRRTAAQALGGLGERVPLEPLFQALQDENWQVRRAAVQALGELGKRVPFEPVLQALQDKNDEVRAAIVRTLGRLGEKVPLEPLLQALQDGDWRVRAAAARALGYQGKRVSPELLTDTLFKESWIVRRSAIQVLEQLGEKAPVAPLVQGLQDENKDIRVTAARALGQLGEQVPIAPFLQALQDEDKELRATAVWSLRRLGEQVPVEILMRALQNENEDVRAAAIQLLRELREQVPVEILMRALQNENEEVRVAAAWSLGQLGEQAPVELLLQALQDEDKELRAAAMWSLGQLGERAPVEPLLRALQDENEDVRAAAIGALGQLGERAPVEPLLRALQDENEDVRVAAIESLGQLRERVPAGLLIQAFQDKSEKVRIAVCNVLGRFVSQKSIAALLSALQDENEAVRVAAVRSLKRQGKRVPVEPLIQMLSDKSYFVRKEAEDILGRLGKQASVEPLLQALHNSEESVQNAVTRVLGCLGAKVPLNPLLQTLQDENWRVRRVTVDVLRLLGKRVPLEPLLQALQDRDGRVRNRVVRALGQLGGEVPVESLLQALEDEDPQVRSAAAWALGRLRKGMPIDPLLQALHDNDEGVRKEVLEALGRSRRRALSEYILPMLGDEAEHVRYTAARVLAEIDPGALETLSAEAIMILEGKSLGSILRSPLQSLLATVIGSMKHSSPELLDTLTQLLDWPCWQVRIRAAQAFGSLRRSIPDSAIRRLLVLRNESDPRMHAVQVIIDDVLAEILSLETGIEDD